MSTEPQQGSMVRLASCCLLANPQASRGCRLRAECQHQHLVRRSSRTLGLGEVNHHRGIESCLVGLAGNVKKECLEPFVADLLVWCSSVRLSRCLMNSVPNLSLLSAEVSSSSSLGIREEKGSQRLFGVQRAVKWHLDLDLWKQLDRNLSTFLELSQYPDVYLHADGDGWGGRDQPGPLSVEILAW
jgi:hypothetical protein